MITATLKPSPLKNEVSIEIFRHMLREARTQIAISGAASRTKAKRYALLMRERGYARGYNEGLAASQTECRAMIETLRSAYDRSVELAARDVEKLARALAGQIIETSITHDPAILRGWIAQAIGALKKSRALRLIMSPLYQGLLQGVSASLPNGITVSTDPAIGSADFRLEGDAGGVEFAWRHALVHAPIDPVT